MNAGIATFIVVASIGLAGCEKHMQDMYDQPRYKPLAESPMFPDGSASQPPVPGTQVHSRGGFASTSSGRQGIEAAERWDRDEHAATNPYPSSTALLDRGRERFDIYCAPCHSVLGDGDGFVVRRGYPAPPSFHSDRLRQQTDRHFVDVIAHGYGVMYPFADRVSPADRWAIVAYIRALQFSQHAPVAALHGDDLAHVGDGGGR
jgi:mono/diheme cytochrome c family protein